jgi:hypothetical protein
LPIKNLGVRTLRKLARLLPGLTLFWAVSAEAAFQITDARITNGSLLISGRTDSPKQKVVIDDKSEVISGSNRRFIWTGSYFPAIALCGFKSKMRAAMW